MDAGWWFGTWISFFALGIIIPIDEVIFFRGVGILPTRLGIASKSIGVYNMIDMIVTVDNPEG